MPKSAFDYYVGLGETRSYAAVATHFGLAKRSVTKRAVREKWQARLKTLETEARAQAERKLREDLQATLERQLRTLRFLQLKSLETLKRVEIDDASVAVRTLLSAQREEREILQHQTPTGAPAADTRASEEMNKWIVDASPVVPAAAAPAALAPAALAPAVAVPVAATQPAGAP